MNSLGMVLTCLIALPMCCAHIISDLTFSAPFDRLTLACSLLKTKPSFDCTWPILPISDLFYLEGDVFIYMFHYDIPLFALATPSR